MNRRILLSAAALLSLGLTTAHAGKLTLFGGTLINPATKTVTKDAIVVIENGRITSIASGASARSPDGPAEQDCRGKFILPGYIDTHVHFFQSGDIFTRPDAVDLNSVRPYKDEVAWVHSHLDDVFQRYLHCGITAVVDVGGPMWNFEVRKAANASAMAPHVAVAGPLISSVGRPQLDVGDPPILKIDGPEQARELVRKLAEQKADFVKIWYIVDRDHPVDSFRPTVKATVEESHAHGIRVAVHATELETARAAIQEGADVLVHSVVDKPVDDEFVRLLLEHKTILTPTLVVFERYGRTFANQLNLLPVEKSLGNPEVIASLDVTKLPADNVPDRIKQALADPGKVLSRIKATYDIAFKNLKTLEDAGVTIAAGTDAGNIGTIHGPSLFREFQLMQEAGLTPMQILQSTTANAARFFGGEVGDQIGRAEVGKRADLVVLNSDPTQDINNASDIHSVIKDGKTWTFVGYDVRPAK